MNLSKLEKNQAIPPKILQLLRAQAEDPIICKSQSSQKIKKNSCQFLDKNQNDGN